ncbi:MAG: response regulator transcription factor [Chitinophagaceae bacterium]|jgi:DNA-binding NarL/FixJ family response regulator|nr:response regulator transcription factor [Chitinophagaceae bacterium]OQY96014.1 MAG: DNA-binding response regulator [Sphingobacteriales bacterium UTBCD1]
MPIRVSIVEDLAEVRDGLAELIRSDKELFLLDNFDNAEAAAEKLPYLKADIVIMDINLPGMSGIECIRVIKEKCPGTQFMMFTVYENDEKVLQAMQAGATGYLLKRTKPQNILESIKELSQGGSPMSSNIARKLLNIFLNEKKSTKKEVLSDRENDVLQLLADGLLYKEIAERLRIAHGTVRHHIHHIYEKLHVQNRTEAVNKFFDRN